VADEQGIATFRVYSHFSLDRSDLYANVVRVKIRLTGPDGDGTRTGFPLHGGFQTAANRV